MRGTGLYENMASKTCKKIRESEDVSGSYESLRRIGRNKNWEKNLKFSGRDKSLGNDLAALKVIKRSPCCGVGMMARFGKIVCNKCGEFVWLYDRYYIPIR